MLLKKSMISKTISKLYKNNLINSTILYGLSTAINKGLILIALPLLGKILSMEEYGIWSLTQIFISLGAPVISLNAFSGILREGVDNKKKGYSVFLKYLEVVSLITTSACLFIFWIDENWIFYTMLLIFVESFQLIILGWYRSQDKHLQYFGVCLAKLIALLFSILLIWEEPILVDLLKYQFVFGAILLFVFILAELFKKHKTEEGSIKINQVFRFSILLIPHSLAQWILSGSDRIAIKWLLNDFELGRYSLAYSIAMILMLVNSGLGLTIPNFVIKNYDKWITGQFKSKILILYGVVTFMITSSIFLFIDFLKEYISIFKAIDYELKLIILILIVGIFLLGIYYFYVNILFYHRKSKTISLITFLVGMFNVLGTIFLVEKIGIFGASIITFASYLIYYLATIYQAIRIEPKLRFHIKKEIGIVLLFSILITVTSIIIINV